MPRWFGRFTTFVFRRQPQLVRVHLKGADESVTGYLRGRWSGQYVLVLAKMNVTAETTVPLAGTVEIPAGNVLLIQKLVSVDGVS